MGGLFYPGGNFFDSVILFLPQTVWSAMALTRFFYSSMMCANPLQGGMDAEGTTPSISNR